MAVVSYFDASVLIQRTITPIHAADLFRDARTHVRFHTRKPNSITLELSSYASPRALLVNFLPVLFTAALTALHVLQLNS